MELPQLIGSDKQIKWADEIRSKTINNLQSFIENDAKRILKWEKDCEKITLLNKLIGDAQKMIEKVSRISDAKKIIQQRDLLMGLGNRLLQIDYIKSQGV